jgi:glycerol kinase
LEAMRADWPHAREATTFLRVDGGIGGNDWLMQFLPDILDAPIERPKILETTARGAAYLAGLAAGVCAAPDTFAQNWRGEKTFGPRMEASERTEKLKGWRDAMRRVL